MERPPRRRGRLRALHRDQSGQALVEFALVAIPLFLIVFGIIDFARALNYYNDLTQIAGQGARAAAVNQDPNGGPADNQFQQQLACRATTAELKGGINVEIVTMPTTSPYVGEPVSVKASYAFTFLPILNLGQITLSSTQTERYESGSAPTYDPNNDVVGGPGSCP